MVRPFSAVSVSFRTLVIWLIAVDVGLILLNVVAFLLAKASIIASVPNILKITQDASLGEDFNYLKWAVIVVALVWMALRDHWLAPFAWAGVFAMILADDSLQFHENIGSLISSDSKLPSNSLLYGSDLGEIIVFLAMGLIAVILTVMMFSRRGAMARIMSVRYLYVLAGLGFFGVGIDALHQVISHFALDHPAVAFLAPVFGLLEDGGEMLVASVATALTLAPPEMLLTDPAVSVSRV